SATGSVNLIVCFSSAARLLRPSLPCAEEPATTYYQPVLGIQTLLPHSCAFCVPGWEIRFVTASLPGRLRNPGNLSAQSQTAETQAADSELAQIGSRAAAQFAAV